ncbi:hypothetical protein [Neogemmobacter tilapiae]|uniref:Uncharacterized protein n=1 Tax=Neogemmobacter tilapiae TaxID=875041 RepID=A0A918WPP1_9RHOB|nr:hypothetical protein [Gemmobacter tilapiae]GHC66065.1 hypothetical protein GCM10007315_33420 [Gemmobacter tilapiae]
MPDLRERFSGLGRPKGQGAVDGLAWAELLAALGGLVWLISVVWSGWGGGIGTLLLAALGPLALILAVLTGLRQVRQLRDEADALRSALDALRAMQAQQGVARVVGSGERRPVEPARRETVERKPVAQAEEQPSLALGMSAEPLRPAMSVEDFIKALDFPEGPEDKDGFRALRLALDDPRTAKMIRAAQDVLTLLSQEGIYMDDLTPITAPAPIWRRFAAGERGQPVAALGGIHDEEALHQVGKRMKEDPVFRDACHHFLRTFDKTLAAFEPEAVDGEMEALAHSRSARAFMLIGRVSGTFD